MHRPCLTVLALAILGAVPGRSSELAGPRIEEILFEPPLVEAMASSTQRAVLIGVGQPLDRAKLGESIRALFRTGRFESIQADAEPSSEGIRLTFLVEPAWFVGNVRVGGVPRPPTEGQLLNASGLQLGELFTERKLAAATRSIRALLIDQGFQEPQIAHSLERDAATQQIHVFFEVDAGTRARIGALLMTGPQSELNEAEVRRIAGWPRDGVFRRDRIQRGIGRLRDHLESQGFWQSEIQVESAEYRAAENQVTLIATIDPGPRMSVRVEGARVGPRRLRRYLPAIARGAVDEDLLASAAKDLRTDFQVRGYFDAKVDVALERERDDRIEITFRVDRGPKQRLQTIEIVGNTFFDESTIRERLQMRPAGMGVKGGQFSEVLLNEDLATIRGLYQSSGFRSVEVTGDLRAGGDRSDRAVRIEIDQGMQTFVADLATSGFEAFPGNESAYDFSSAPGRPFSESNIQSDRQRILTEYYDAGFRDVTFDWRAEPGAAPSEVVLHYVVGHGDQILTGPTIVSGTRRTREQFLARRLELAQGAPLSQSGIFATQRNLYDLGVFSKVEVALQNPEGEEEAKAVLLQVEEARRWAVDAGGGAEFARIGRNTAELTNPAGDATFSPRMTLEVTRLNMFGRAHTISVRTRLSILQQRGLFAYEAPRWFDSDRWRMTVTGLYDTFRNVNTFTGRRLEGAFQLSQQLDPRTTVLYRYAYRRTSIDQETLHIQPLLVPLVSQPVRVGLMSSTLISDRRDDPTDTSKGIYNTVNIALASKYVGAQPNFARMLAQNSTYHPVGRRMVFARTIQLGVALPWAGYGVAGVAEARFAGRPDPRIPISERYFGGGANSHRGFPYNQAGPRDPATGFPLGGGSQFLNSVELRFPVAGPDISGVVFHDAGNVYSRPGRISFRPRQAIRQDGGGATEYEFDYMVHALGLGIRYRTPIGPVRLDVAYSPNPPRFVGFDGTRTQLLTGTGSFREQRISPFQLHFSLGQTF